MENKELFNMIGSLIAIHRENKIDDLDLYNSILRIVYFSTEEDKLKLKKIVEWLDTPEKSNTDKHEQYSYENVTKNTGEEYREGLMRIQSL
jgi:hypothetical protein